MHSPTTPTQATPAAALTQATPTQGQICATTPTTTLTQGQIRATAESIVACQQPNGMILWYDGGHADVWNHTEAAMALTVASSATADDTYLTAATWAFEWLRHNQLPNGSWHNYYIDAGIEDAQIDTNCCAYPAVGVWHHYVTTDDRAFAERMWPMVDRALNFVVGLARSDGHIPWAIHTDRTPWSYSLLAGSCSITMSLDAGLALAAELGHRRPKWKSTLKRLRQLIVDQPESFEPKHRWAMDWYYPVLCGAVTGAAALVHLTSDTNRFVCATPNDATNNSTTPNDATNNSTTPNDATNNSTTPNGVRCVSDKAWITAAETCECALAYLRAGDPVTARRLFRACDDLRDNDGAYFTGLVLPQRVTFPHEERSSYTAAVVLLAADALDELTPAAGVLLNTAVS